MISVIVFILIISLIGFTILSVLNLKFSPLEMCSLVFPVGASFITLYCWFLSAIKVYYSVNVIFVPLIIVSVILLIVNYIFSGKINKEINTLIHMKKRYQFQVNNIATLFVIAILLIQYLFLLTHSITANIYQPDELSHWGFQAKVIFEGKSLESFYGGNGFETGFEIYPSFVPLLAVSYYIFSDQVIDSFVRIIGPLFLGSLLLHLYTELNKILEKKIISLILLGIFLSSGYVMFEMSTGLYADIEYAFFYYVSVVYMVRYFTNENDLKNLIYSAVFLGLASWTKTDGQYIAIMHIILFFIINFKNNKFKIKDNLMFIVISLFIPITWKIYTILRNFPDSRWSIDPHPEFIIPMLQASVNQIFNTSSWGLFWIIIFGFVISNFHVKIKRNQLFLLAIIVSNIAFLYFSYIVMFGAEAPSAASFSRYVLRIAPISLLYIALVMKSSFNLEKEYKT